jgi:UDP-N-acetylmuramoyl-tripeptide--D-alanyl-D-alanine ligase
MLIWDLNALAGAVGGEVRLVPGRCQVGAAVSVSTRRLRGAGIDSRCLRPGEVFVALPGGRQDGHDHVVSALRSGAAAALVSRAWAESQAAAAAPGPLLLVDDPLQALQQWATAHIERSGVLVVGVTGSNGKTTTKELIVAALGGSPRVAGSRGNYNNQIGLPLSVLSLPEECEIAVLEMGMSTLGEISNLVSIAPPDVAVITSLGVAHLESLGNLAGIAAAKLEIAERNPALVVLPSDAPLLRHGIARDHPHARVTLCGEDEGAHLRAAAVELDSAGRPSFQVSGRGTLHLPLIGAHNIGNALAAIAVAEHFGRSWEQIVESLESVQSVPMRTEPMVIAGIQFINDAYNSNPASMEAALALLRDTPGVGGRRVLVAGAMLELGERSEELHRQVGDAVAGSGIDLLLAVGALGAEIAAGAHRSTGHSPPPEIMVVADPHEAGRWLAKWALAGDLVLLKASRGVALEAAIEAFAEARAGRKER